MSDPDALLDKAAKAILATRAPGLGKQQWARRAAAAVFEACEIGGGPCAICGLRAGACAYNGGRAERFTDCPETIPETTNAP